MRVKISASDAFTKKFCYAFSFYFHDRERNYFHDSENYFHDFLNYRLGQQRQPHNTIQYK